MKNVLVLGSGQSSTYLVAKLLEDAVEEDLFVTVGDRDLAVAAACIGDHPRGAAVRLDINDAGLRSAEIERSALVLDMLPSTFHNLVAWDCVAHGRDMLSVSYRDQTTRDLDLDAKRQGILLLSEMGLDPGIDHMSAMALINQIQAAGGRIEAFRSYGSGIPAPHQAHNPLRYVLTWDPRNVVMAGQGGPSTWTTVTSRSYPATTSSSTPGPARWRASVPSRPTPTAMRCPICNPLAWSTCGQ